MKIIELLDRPIAFHRCLVEITGSCNGALLLSQAIYWQNRPSRDSTDGWWYKTREDWKSETGLSRKELETARRGCSGILLHKKKGVPPVTYYKVNVEELEKRLLTVQSVPIIRSEPNRSNGPKGAVQTDRNEQTISTETTTETTTKYQGELLKPEPCDWGKICPCLETSPKAKDLWHQWMIDRRKHKKPALDWLEFFARQAHWLKQFDSMTVIEILEKSVVNGYQGLFEPKKAKKQSSGESATQEMSRILKGIT